MLTVGLTGIGGHADANLVAVRQRAFGEGAGGLLTIELVLQDDLGHALTGLVHKDVVALFTRGLVDLGLRLVGELRDELLRAHDHLHLGSVAAFGDLERGSIGGLDGLGHSLGRSLSGLRDGLCDFRGSLSGGLGRSLSGLRDGLGNFRSRLGRSLSGLRDGFLNGLGDFLDLLLDSLGGFLDLLLNGLGDFLHHRREPCDGRRTALRVHLDQVDIGVGFLEVQGLERALVAALGLERQRLLDEFPVGLVGHRDAGQFHHLAVSQGRLDLVAGVLIGHVVVQADLHHVLTGRIEDPVDPGDLLGSGLLGRSLDDLSRSLGRSLSGLRDGLGDFRSSLGRSLGRGLDGLSHSLGRSLSGLRDGLGDFRSSLGRGLDGLSHSLGRSLSGLRDGLGDFRGRLGHSLGRGLDSLSDLLSYVDLLSFLNRNLRGSFGRRFGGSLGRGLRGGFGRGRRGGRGRSGGCSCSRRIRSGGEVGYAYQHHNQRENHANDFLAHSKTSSFVHTVSHGRVNYSLQVRSFQQSRPLRCEFNSFLSLLFYKCNI